MQKYEVTNAKKIAIFLATMIFIIMTVPVQAAEVGVLGDCRITLGIEKKTVFEFLAIQIPQPVQMKLV